jgi:TonB family protein
MNWDNRAFVITAAIYTLILFLILFLGFSTPLPLPAEEGILINFGEDETGSGTIEPRPSEEVAMQMPTTPVVEDAVEELLTQDVEDAPTVASTNENPLEQPEETHTEPSVEKPVEEVVEETPQVNPNAMYRGRKPDSDASSSEGSAGGTGNQGDLSGDTEAPSHSLGAGAGDGISYSLNGRSPVRLPVPEFNTQKEGTVVVRIRVDRSGNVTSAEPGVKGSTTLDKELLAAAKRAALLSRFNNKQDAAIIQEGTITYVFRLRGK